MAARPLLLGLILATAVLAAGCTNDTAQPPANERPPPAGNDAQPPAGNAPPTPSAAPQDYVLEDSGDIEGAFEHAWDVEVANVAFRDAGITFTLRGIEPGVPPTARVHLTLYDPNGVPLQSGSVGLGAEANELTWSFTPGQLPLAGSYTLKAATADSAPLPSGGYANWDLAAHVTY